MAFRNKKKNGRFSLVALAAGFILLAYLVISFDYSELDFSNLSITFLNVGCLLFLLVLYFLIRGVRWQVLLRAAGIQIPFFEVYLRSSASIAISSYSPGQIGDLIKLQFLKNDFGIKRRNSFPTMIVEKGVDLLIITVIFIAFTIYSSKKFFDINLNIVLPVIMGFIIVSIIIILAIYKKIEWVKETMKSTKDLLGRPVVVFFVVLLSLISWSVIGGIWRALAIITNIDMPLSMICFLVSSVAIVSIISYVPGAIGVLEFSVVALLTAVSGITMNQAVVFAIALRAQTILVFGIGIAHLLFRKAHKSLIKKNF